MLVSAVTTDIADRFPDPHQRPHTDAPRTLGTGRIRKDR